jgi:glucose/arabinose dehydrogenase
MRNYASKIVRGCWCALLLGSLAACGGGGGSNNSSSSSPVAQTGSLTVTIAALPAGSNAAVTVSGPGLSTSVTATQTLTGLTPGTFTIAANGVSTSGALFAPQSASQAVVVTAGATATATVTYGAVRLALQAVASGLNSPLLLTAPVGDARMFIVERPGTIRIMRSGSVLATPFIDLTSRISTVGEGGLLSVAFDPHYATSGFFFVYFVDLNGNIAVERFHASSNPDVADPSPLRILSIAHPVNTNHYGGLLAFGSDGFLYMGVGDGGGAGDVPGNAQNLNMLLGKLLRIDVSLSNQVQPYVVPTGNPFVGQVGRRGEIWAYGLRNPWRYAFDVTAGLTYIADVGQDRREEIDVVSSTASGVNFGWNITEGTLCYPTDPCSTTGITLPVLEYGHDATGGCSISGGSVYRGSAIPVIAGRYFYSDFCSGFLRSIAFVNGVATEQIDWNIANVGQILSFGLDAQGEIYMLSATGTVYRIVRSA